MLALRKTGACEDAPNCPLNGSFTLAPPGAPLTTTFVGYFLAFRIVSKNILKASFDFLILFKGSSRELARLAASLSLPYSFSFPARIAFSK